MVAVVWVELRVVDDVRVVALAVVLDVENPETLEVEDPFTLVTTVVELDGSEATEVVEDEGGSISVELETGMVAWGG